MTIPTRYSWLLSFTLASVVLAAAPPKATTAAATPSAKGSVATKDPSAKAKKKKLIRPGVEWEPAPAPLKW